MTRRDFLRVSAGAVAIPSALASPTRSSLAARGMSHAEFPHSDYTAADYIQDGLIVMWDGIENVGYGVHDDNATIWSDLAGRYDLEIQSGYFSKNHYVVGGGNCAVYRYTPPYNVLTIEIVMSTHSISVAGEKLIWGVRFRQQSDKRLVCWEFKGGIGFGFNGYGKRVSADIPFSIVSTFSDVNQIAPTQTYYNGKNEIFTNTQDYFNTTNAWQMSINPRYGTFSGKIYAIRLYDYPLNSEEIAYNYMIDKERFGLWG